MMGLLIIPIAIIACALYVWNVHRTLKKDFVEEQWLETDKEQESEADIFLN